MEENMIDFEEDILETKKPTTSANTENMLWVNKYRPRTLDHFCLEPQLMKKFTSWIEANDIQSCSLIGGPGIGKTTLALILANSAPDNDILFIPCAIEGKVETIQSKIIPFCQSASRGKKIIILDELDSASATQANSFQKSLRNTIEIYKDCRWIATANYGPNIISPILSRLIPFNLSFSVSDMISNLLYIIGQENVEIVSEPAKTKQFLGNLIKSYYPDMRAVVGFLQSACVSGKLDVDEVLIDNKEAIRLALVNFLNTINESDTPLNMRKAYNNAVLSFGNNGALASLCSPYGLASALFNHIVVNFNASTEDLMALVEQLYKIEHSVDQETMLFGFLLKVKTMGLKQ
jgi:DNA polymerase III delta prime subunit